MHVEGIVAPALGPIASEVRLLKSEGTKKENEREFLKKKLSEAHLEQVFHRAH